MRSVGTIRSYEFARDIRKDIEGNPFAGKMHPCRWPTTRMANRRRPKPTTPPCSTSRLFLAGRRLLRLAPSGFPAAAGGLLHRPVHRRPARAFTAGRALVNLFSVAGVPTLVVPGELTAGGMPLGIQLVGPALSERLLLDAGTAYETTYGPFPTPPLVSA
mgnify:CR=1 FL=1